MYPAIFLGEFFLLLNTAPLERRAGEFGKRAYSRHCAGGEHLHHSPARRRLLAHLIGYISDRTNLEIGMTAMVVAVALSAAILFYGMRFAPKIST